MKSATLLRAVIGSALAAVVAAALATPAAAETKEVRLDMHPTKVQATKNRDTLDFNLSKTSNPTNPKNTNQPLA